MEYQVDIHTTTSFENGFATRIETPPSDDEADPRTTAGHEAFHGVTSEEDGASVEEMSAVPLDAHVLGYTKVARYTEAGFAAAHAFGCLGTSHDKRVIEFHGGSVGSGGRRARNLLRGKMHLVAGVAQALRQYGKLSRQGFLWAMEEAERKKQGTFKENETSVVVITSSGRGRRMGGVKTENGKAMIPGEWVELGKAS